MTDQQRILAISQYEGAKPKFMKGLYSAKNSYWKCGNCGSTLRHDVIDNYCFNCGYGVLWDNPRCLTGYDDKGKVKQKDLKGQITLEQLIN